MLPIITTPCFEKFSNGFDSVLLIILPCILLKCHRLCVKVTLVDSVRNKINELNYFLQTLLTDKQF